MTEHANKPVSFEPSEVQKLRLQLAQSDCQLNIAKRCHLEAELKFYKLAYSVAEAALPQIEQQLAELEREGAQLTQAFVNEGEQIKVENGWDARVRLEFVTLRFSVPAESSWAPEQSTESKFSIQ